MRAALGAGLPLAGVGCAIARGSLDTLAAARDGAQFDPASLTEDYELGLTVARDGGRGTFVRKFHGYEQMPPDAAQKVIEEASKETEMAEV